MCAIPVNDFESAVISILDNKIFVIPIRIVGFKTGDFNLFEERKQRQIDQSKLLNVNLTVPIMLLLKNHSRFQRSVNYYISQRNFICKFRWCLWNFLRRLIFVFFFRI
jgi:hypothetical protein